MTPPTATDSALTIAAQFFALFAISVDRVFAVITERQETIHWLATTGAGVLAGIAALLAIYRHVRALRRK